MNLFCFLYTECLQNGEPLPLPFCYVPCQKQLQELSCRKAKHADSKKLLPSPVDKTIPFFGSRSGGRLGPSERERLDTSPEGSSDLVSSCEEPDIWDHLHADKLWETVLVYYYSLCNVSLKSRLKTLKVYLRKKIKRKRKKNRSKDVSKQCPSYAEIATKLGILTLPSSSQQSSSHQDSETDSTTDSMADSKTDSVTDSTQDSRCQDSDKTCNTHPSAPPADCGARAEDPQDLQGHTGAGSVSELQNSDGYTGDGYRMVLINQELAHMDQLHSPFMAPWALEEDLTLVQFLCDSSNKFNSSRSKV